MGLIHMLANLSDPANGTIDRRAFIATLYGVASAT